MPDIGADTSPIAFGDFQRGYVIADRVGILMGGKLVHLGPPAELRQQSLNEIVSAPTPRAAAHNAT